MTTNQNNTNSQDYIDEINEKLNFVTHRIDEEFNKLRNISRNINIILENNCSSNIMNKNFDDQELIEEQFDNLIFNYSNVKELLKMGRQLRYYKEQNEMEKRYARNVLAQYGINPTN